MFVLKISSTGQAPQVPTVLLLWDIVDLFFLGVPYECVLVLFFF